MRHVAPIVLATLVAAAGCSTPPAALGTPPQIDAIGEQAVAENAAFSFQVAAHAPAGVALDFAVRNAPPGLVISDTGLVTWTPTFDQAGRYSVDVIVTARDGGALSASAVLEIVVSNTNRAPEISGVAATLDALEPGATVDVTAFAQDVDGDALTYTWTLEGEGWTKSGEGAAVHVTAPSTFGSTAGVTLEVSDGTDTAKFVTSLHTRTARDPILAPLATSARPFEPGQALAFTAVATDPLGRPLSYKWETTGEGWSVEGSGATVQVLAPAAIAAQGTLKVTVTNPDGRTASSQVVVRTRANQAPSLVLVPAENPLAREGRTQVRAVAADPEQDPITVAWTISGAGWALDKTAGDVVQVSAPAQGNAEATLVAVATDRWGATNEARVVLHTRLGSAPAIGSLIALDSQPLAGTETELQLDASDADGDALTYAWTSSNAAWTISGTGAHVTIAAPATVGTSTVVRVTVTDAEGQTATASLSLRARGATIGGTIALGASEEPVTLHAGDGLDLTVTKSGNFSFPGIFEPGTRYELRPVDTGLPTRSCTIENGFGNAFGAVTSIKVVCHDSAAQVRFVPAQTLTTTSTAYTDIPGLRALSFDTQNARGKLLVTLSVSRASGEPTPGVNGSVWAGIDVDGVTVAEARWQNAFWGQGGPLSAYAVVPVTPGTHVVKGRFRKGAEGQSAVIESFPVTLAAVELDQLANFASHAGVSSTLGGTTTATSAASAPLVPFPALDLVLSPNQPLLTLEQLPSVTITGENAPQIQQFAGTSLVAESAWEHEGTAHGTTLSSLSLQLAPTSISSRWYTSGGELGLGTEKATLDAIAWRAGTLQASWRGTYTEAGTAETDYQPLPGTQLTLTLPAARRTLIGVQLPSAFSTNNGTSGRIGLEVNGTVVQDVVIQSQNGSRSSPVQLFALEKLPAGTSTIRVLVRSENAGTYLGVTTQRTANLWAVALE